MSLATDYAARQQAAADGQVAANQSEPPKLDGPNGSLVVDATGNLRVVPRGTGGFIVTPQVALAMAAWINATFGEPPPP